MICNSCNKIQLKSSLDFIQQFYKNRYNLQLCPKCAYLYLFIKARQRSFDLIRLLYNIISDIMYLLYLGLFNEF